MKWMIRGINSCEHEFRTQQRLNYISSPPTKCTQISIEWHFSLQSSPAKPNRNPILVYSAIGTHNPPPNSPFGKDRPINNRKRVSIQIIGASLPFWCMIGNTIDVVPGKEAFGHSGISSCCSTTHHLIHSDIGFPQMIDRYPNIGDNSGLHSSLRDGSARFHCSYTAGICRLEQAQDGAVEDPAARGSSLTADRASRAVR